MKKITEKIVILFLTVVAVTVFIAPQPLSAQATPPTDPCKAFLPGTPAWRECDKTKNSSTYDALKKIQDADNPSFWANIFRDLFATLGTLALQVTGLIVGIAGAMLNGIVYYTIVKVADNYNNLGPILETWRVIRDLANMSFIFVLLYAGIQTMIGQGGSDTKKVITGVIVAAVLMNFSIFFTRLVIDVANTLALTFYDAIAPGVTENGFLSWGLSNAFMTHLNLASLYKLSLGNKVTWDSILTIGVMGSIMLLVAAFTFFAIAIFFIIRYVVLILVMILSPIYFVSFALPKDAGIDKYAKQWKDALFGQAFFAPVYFLMVWVSLRIMEGIFQVFEANSSSEISQGALSGLTIGGAPSMGSLMMVLNFGMVITLLITSLVVAKSMADKAGGGIGQLTSWVSGKAGSATFGFAGNIGRSTIGRAGQALGESERLKNSAANGGMIGRFAARQALNVGRGVGAASFDARGIGVGGKEAGKAGGKGGFADYRKKKAEEEEKFAKSLAPSDKTKAEAKGRSDELERIYRENKKQFGPKDSRTKEAKDKFIKARDIADRVGGVKPEELTKRAKEEIDALPSADKLTEANKKVEEAEEKYKENKNSVERGERKLKDDPILRKEVEIREDIKRKQEEVDEAHSPELKTARANELNLKQVELENIRQQAEERRQAIREEITLGKEAAARQEEELTQAQEARKKEKSLHEAGAEEIKKKYGWDEDTKKYKARDGDADARKKAFATSVEKSAVAKFRGYNYAAAAKIRGGKSANEEAAEALKKLAKANNIDTGEPQEEGGKKEGEKDKPTT